MDIIKILEDHGILHYITDLGSIMALDTETYINVSNFTKAELYQWLGY